MVNEGIGMQQLRNNRPLTIAIIIGLIVLAFAIFNLTNLMLVASIIQSLAITALCIVACLYIAKRI